MLSLLRGFMKAVTMVGRKKNFYIMVGYKFLHIYILHMVGDKKSITLWGLLESASKMISILIELEESS